MAEHFLSSIYRKNQYDLKNPAGNPANQGVPHSFPVGLTHFYPAPTNTVANGVTMASIIELLPTGLNQPSNKFYTPDTVTALNTASNAALGA